MNRYIVPAYLVIYAESLPAADEAAGNYALEMNQHHESSDNPTRIMLDEVLPTFQHDEPKELPNTAMQSQGDECPPACPKCKSEDTYDSGFEKFAGEVAVIFCRDCGHEFQVNIESTSTFGEVYDDCLDGNERGEEEE